METYNTINNSMKIIDRIKYQSVIPIVERAAKGPALILLGRTNNKQRQALFITIIRTFSHLRKSGTSDTHFYEVRQSWYSLVSLTFHLSFFLYYERLCFETIDVYYEAEAYNIYSITKPQTLKKQMMPGDNLVVL